MGALSRLDVPIVHGHLRDRWFVALKPPGFLATAFPRQPSVEATLQPFCEDRVLSFPLRPEKDSQGLLIVTTDDAMRKCFDDLVRERLIKSTFRVLADVSRNHAALAPPPGLPFVGADRLASGRLLGSLWMPGGRSLVQRGFLRSQVATRPLRMRHGGLDRPRGAEAASAVQATPVWTKPSALRQALDGEEVPLALHGVASRSLLNGTRSLQGPPTHANVAVTEFELLGGAEACPQDPSLVTAMYGVRAHTSASHQIRVHFADAGCPILYDPYYHPRYNREVRRKLAGVEGEGSRVPPREQQWPRPRRPLAMQLCALDMPDPLKPSERLTIKLRSAPSEWALLRGGDGSDSRIWAGDPESLDGAGDPAEDDVLEDIDAVP